MKLVALAKALDNFLTRVGKKDEPPDWKKLHEIADKMMPKVRDAFLKAIAVLQSSVVLSQVETALNTNDIDAVMESINWPVLTAEAVVIAQTIFAGIAEQASTVAADALATKIGLRYSFDLINQVAVDWAKEYTGDLITQISDESKKAIRAVIVDAFENGGHPYDTARKIRQYIGLTERDAVATLNYWRKIATDGTVRSDKQLADMEAAYVRKKIRERAETIARTETINASAEGQRILWEKAKNDGKLAGFERKWIVTPDDRLCVKCAAMKGQRAPIGGTYPNGSRGPTLHPRCRCAEGLVEVNR